MQANEARRYNAPTEKEGSAFVLLNVNMLRKVTTRLIGALSHVPYAYLPRRRWRLSPTKSPESTLEPEPRRSQNKNVQEPSTPPFNFFSISYSQANGAATSCKCADSGAALSLTGGWDPSTVEPVIFAAAA